MSIKKVKKNLFSALEVATICGVVNQTAINWIRRGYLKASLTPGGQFRVSPDDLAAFMSSRNMGIPDSLLSYCKDKNTYELDTLLIIDDDRTLNCVLATYISGKFPNLKVIQAYDGFEAGLNLSSKHPQCLILDLDLPGINGFEICKRIFQDLEFGSPCVIVITALEDDETLQKLTDIGVKHIFHKPLKMDMIGKIVGKIYREV